MSSKTKARQIIQLSDIEHVERKSMWAGSKKMQSLPAYIIKTITDEENNDKYEILEPDDVVYIPAVRKIIEEVVGNAIDQFTHYSDITKQIRIDFNKTTGEISVYNDGQGFEIIKTKNRMNKEMYMPQLAASEFRAGDNLEEKTGNIKAGTNGAGLKVAGVFSTKLTLCTTDVNRKLNYVQVFSDGLRQIDKPIITKTSSKKLKAEQKKGGTRITFTPRYKWLGVKKSNMPSLFKAMDKLNKALAYKTAAYTESKVYYNNKLISIKGFADFAQLLTDNPLCTTISNPNDSKLNWVVSISESTIGKFQQFTIVNGIHIPRGGNHIKHLQNMIFKHFEPKVQNMIKDKRKVNKNIVLNNLFIMMKGPIPDPDFLSQTKDHIDNPINNFSCYKLPIPYMNKVWLAVKDSIYASFMKGHLGKEKTRVNRGRVNVDKYRRARLAGSAAHSHKCKLIVCEGDAAWGTVATGITHKSNTMSFDFYGIFSIQGVPPNGLKESTFNQNLNKYIPNKKLLGKNRLEALREVLGLDYNKSYDFTPKGEKDVKKIRYGKCDIMVDQDYDGTGNIFSLIITYFTTFWPSLIKRGFIRRLNTPVIRIYPKPSAKANKYVEAFYSKRQFEIFCSKYKDINKHYTIHYYKGLGGHAEVRKEVSSMFLDYEGMILTYSLDSSAIDTVSIYHGKTTANRKKALKTPSTEEHIDGERTIPVSRQMNVDTKAYQRNNIIRKLAGIDGFVISRRKVFFTMRQLQKKIDIKVQKVAGETVSRGGYDHGESSLESTIIKMAQEGSRARNLPLLRPFGNFGTMSKGYKNPASSRYIYTRLNEQLADKMFPIFDDYLLNYDIDEGQQYQPTTYCPIIPYVLLENDTLPGTGWKIEKWARDYNDIITNLKNIIKGKQEKCNPLHRYWSDIRNAGDDINYENPQCSVIKRINGKEYSVGYYIYDESNNTVIVTDLPLGEYPEHYIYGSEKPDCRCVNNLEYVDYVEDDSSDNDIYITIHLHPNSIDNIKELYNGSDFDAFEKYFFLVKSINHHLNLVDEKGNVIEYKSYSDVFDAWYIFRKKLYIDRIDREIIILQLQIIRNSNQQRFAKHHASYNITSNTSYTKIIQKLTQEQYIKINNSVLNNPKFIRVNKLKKAILDIDASYDYLINMTYRQLSKDASAERAKKIANIKKRIEYLQDNGNLFKGGKIWLEEIEDLDKTIRLGFKLGWGFGKDKVIHRVAKKATKK